MQRGSTLFLGYSSCEHETFKKTFVPAKTHFESRYKLITFFVLKASLRTQKVTSLYRSLNAFFWEKRFCFRSLFETAIAQKSVLPRYTSNTFSHHFMLRGFIYLIVIVHLEQYVSTSTQLQGAVVATGAAKRIRIRQEALVTQGIFRCYSVTGQNGDLAMSTSKILVMSYYFISL